MFSEVVVAFSPKAVNTLVVPLIKLPETVKLTAVAVPDNAGLASGAFKFSAVCVKLETFLFASAVLSTLAKSTIAFVMPKTVPEKVGLARGALAAKAFVIVVAKLASPFNADEISCNVFNNAGAAPIKSLILVSVWDLV